MRRPMKHCRGGDEGERIAKTIEEEFSHVWRSDQLNVLMKTNIIPVSQWRGGCVKKEFMKIKNVNK